ncbi:LamB/YcsF family protein [Planctomonas deserti]|uniref:LamB/YcsF family protein n=1 Tax=Planctomonas deserti TaxID=2144185 RepID=UPI000D38CEAD|nr:5-oxoprolinase subunit PxpA [Planctomonas deserti]
MDLNSDLGETVDGMPTADDAALFALVTSANVACGFHAGDERSMRDSCRLAVRHGVALGAHVSYDDREGFGRRDVDVTPTRLREHVLTQLRALGEAAAESGARIRYVKPHGALYNRIVHDRAQADAVAGAVRDFSPGLPLLGLPGSAIEAAADTAGSPFFREAFVDRGYRPDGTLVPRGSAGALLGDGDGITERAVRLATTGRVRAVDGTELELRVDSLCVHGDTPGAVDMAHSVRAALIAAGVPLTAFA